MTDVSVAWPKTPEEVRDFIGPHFCAVRYRNEVEPGSIKAPPASEHDIYLVSAHDLLSAFSSWTDEWETAAARPDQESKAAQAAQSEQLPADVLEALRDGLSVCMSVSTSVDRRVNQDGCVSYRQTQEWCRWLEDEVGPRIRAVLEKAGGIKGAL